MTADDPWDRDDGDELEAEIMRADHAFGAESFGTTAEEVLAGSPSINGSPRSDRTDHPLTRSSASAPSPVIRYMSRTPSCACHRNAVPDARHRVLYRLTDTGKSSPPSYWEGAEAGGGLFSAFGIPNLRVGSRVSGHGAHSRRKEAVLTRYDE